MSMAARADWLVRKPKFSVLPLHTIDTDTGYCTCGSPSCSSPGKHPIASLAPHGVHDATTDPSQVAQWWAMWPDANIGIATGDTSGVIVLDIDAKSGGIRSWSNLQDRHGSIEETWMVSTGGGGIHVYFRYEPGTTNRVGVAPGIDVRSDNGYVVAPPSIHSSGNTYEWMEGMKPSASFQQPGYAPEWLMKMLGSSTERTRASAVVGKISEGGRNHTLASLAGTMRARGMENDEILAALRVVNSNRCDPPLPDKEVSTIAWSVSRYSPATAIVQSLRMGQRT